MNSAVSAMPITAAQALAVIAAAPSVGPTVRCSTISTGTGSEPPLISRARSAASSEVKVPVIWVDAPGRPTSQATSSFTWGETITLESSTMATRRLGSPAGLQAARPVSSAHSARPLSRKSTVTNQPLPCWASMPASAPLTPSPVRAAGPMCSGPPRSSGRICSPLPGSVPAAGSGTPRTGWKVSCAVLPMTSAALVGSCTPGSSTMMRRSPERASGASATPRPSARRRSTSRVRSVAAASALTVGESLVSSTSWVPPRRSRPRRGDMVRAMNSEVAMTASAATARTTGARDMGASTGWGNVLGSCRRSRSQDAGVLRVRRPSGTGKAFSGTAKARSGSGPVQPAVEAGGARPGLTSRDASGRVSSSRAGRESWPVARERRRGSAGGVASG